MNSGNSNSAQRAVVLGGGVLAVLVGLAARWVFGGDTVAGSTAGLVAGGLVFAAAFLLFTVLFYCGTLRIPAARRALEVRRRMPGALVLDADMSSAFREWIRAHPIDDAAAAARVSRFGVTLAADSRGLWIWGGVRSTPRLVALLDWAAVTALLPPKPADFIGASTAQTAVIVVFDQSQPPLRIPLVPMSPPVGTTGDYHEARDTVAALNGIRTARNAAG